MSPKTWSGLISAMDGGRVLAIGSARDGGRSSEFISAHGVRVASQPSTTVIFHQPSVLNFVVFVFRRGVLRYNVQAGGQTDLPSMNQNQRRQLRQMLTLVLFGAAVLTGV